MLTKEGCLARRKRLWDSVPNDVEWLLIADPRHVLYLSNFWIHPLSFSAGERGLLLLERDNGATLLCDNFAIGSTSAEPHVDRQVVETWYDHEHSPVNRDHALLRALAQVAGQLKGRRGLVEAEWLPLAAWEILPADDVQNKPVPNRPVLNGPESDHPTSLGTILRTLRRRKDPDEITLLRQCMRAGDAGHARAWDVIRTGISEMEVFREVQNAA